MSVFIHLGGDVTVSTKHVIAILDSRNAELEATQEFLRDMERQGLVFTIDDKDRKSFVITDTCVYISPISTVTLKKRAELRTNIDD